ncbi:cilia- and flagella-associated protein 46-like isoform X7 [Ostrea edulis]|uniref:cilia- and flagella-associated protein 46-like isoform X7 n=1 Tax=Ostrea edulis TaxID=37623 RepID=UPI0024AF14E0|nr:cilia- and flagella-associated protein 46-like isoform X7 [Ostrea edulis]
MDTSIRTLLTKAQAFIGHENNQHLHQAYQLLRNVAESKPAVDTPESFGSDLYVICAETAFQNGMPDMARECLKMYFMKPPPANQFLCRAYLCQAQLLAPKEANYPEQLEKAVVYLVKAISFAKKNPRYHFLVYNASVIYWQFCRPFLKHNYRQYLARSLHQVVKALDDIDDKDFEWRAQLMIALMECHLDAGRKTDASSVAGAAATFIKQNVPHLYKQVFGLIVRNQLLDSSKLHKDVKNSPELSVFYKILKLKVSSDLNEPREFYSEIQSILNQMGVAHTSTVQVETPTGKGSKSKSIRTHSPGPAKMEELEKDRSFHWGNMKSPTKGTGRRTPTPTTTKRLATDSADKLVLPDEERPYLLLELARFCVELEFSDLAQDCVDHMKTCVVKDPSFYLELEFLQCELMVRSLGDKQETFNKSVVDLRIQAIKRCEETIMNAIRQGDPNVIQAGCVTQWNLILPLLQPNLRKHARKPLTLLAEALEDIQSLLISLRCQVHTELSKCEEDQEQIQVAMEHLKKALALDDGGLYKERLEVSLHRLELRAQLYQQPERAEDMAAMIIEQARKADSGTMRMKRSLLVKAGEALAPDAFQLVLDSESDTKDVTGGKAPQTAIQKLANKARQFNKCVRKAEGHLKRLGDENDRERVENDRQQARLWGDLAKTARKQEVWDVCRVAARFCLLYDDGRWKNVPPPKMESPKPSEKVKTPAPPVEQSTTGTGSEATPSGVELSERKSRMMTQQSQPGSRPTSPDRMVPLYDKDLIRMLAEVAFIQGEATVHLLRTEGVQLNDMPIPPVDKSKRPKGYVAKKPEEDPDWIEYCDWIKSLSDDTTHSFLRGLELGVELEEPWLVCSAAAYIWNYNNHVLTQRRHREVMDTLTKVIEGVKKVGHDGETMMLVNICGALAFALMCPWIPDEPVKEMQDPSSPSPSGAPSPGGGKKGGKPAPPAASPAKGKAPAPSSQVTISPDAVSDLKKAIEVCEYAIEVTNGSKEANVVPIGVRQPLLQTWVLAKQMAQQQIPKTLGADDEPHSEGQRQMTRAIVAVELLHVSKNGIMEFKETPTVNEIANMIEECKWSDKFVELQLWTRLASLSYQGKNHPLVVKCSKKALRFATVGTQPKNRKMDAHRYAVEQEMLSYASGVLGQSLIDNMSGKNAIRREALEAFLNSARFARNAENYDLVMTAVRHYWNACLPLVSQPIERELLREPIKVMLQCITATAEKIKKTEEKTEDDEDEEGGEDDQGVETAPEKPKSSTIGSPEDDLTLRASMYGVLFQSYADKEQWEEGLQAMDQAINDMPRTKHRLLIFKHRVMTKAKLGRRVNMDIQKFKHLGRRDESEDYVAHMWRRVALSSKETLEQLISYQAAIEALNSPSNEWLKVDYLLEFGQWLYSNEFPLQDAIDQLEWAVDIMLNMKTETDLKKEAEAALSSVDTKSTPKKGSAGKRGKGAAKGKADKKKPGRSSAKTKPAPPPTVSKTPVPGDKASDAASDSKSVTSETDSDLMAEGIIPIAKQAVIGVLPNNPSLTINDLDDVKQIDGLFRAHVLLAELAGRSSPDYKDYLLQAHAYLIRLWQITVLISGPVMKEIAKNPPAAADDKNAASAKGKGKGGKDEKKDAVKEKPKRKGPLDVLPTIVEEWAQYDLPDEVIEAFHHDMMKVTGINSHTIQKPMLTLHYLDTLVECLRDVGYNHLTLPILAFEDLMSRDLLKSEPLHVLVHSKAAEVCLELNLKNGYNYHEKLAGPVVLNEEHQALSRDEIALWQEKQIQVAREEARVKESLAKLAEESKGSQLTRRATNKGGVSVIENKEETIQSHLGKTLGNITYRDVWTDTAELLIRQCHYQSAREFLNEANNAALAFEDNVLRGRILYLLGQLSLEEAQYKQAFNLALEAQGTFNGDEMFWYKTSMLMVEATLKDYENRRRQRIARGILVHTINEFHRIADERPNRTSINVFILSMMEAKLASVQTQVILSGGKDINDPKVMTKMLSACEKFESSIEKLIKLGYKREVLPVMKDHALVLCNMARHSLEKEIIHTYYMQSMMVLKEGVSLAEEAFRDTLTLTSLQEVRNVSLPIQRELADMYISCGDVMLEMFRVHAKETRTQQLEDLRKGSVVKMVEDFIRTTPQYYSHMEKEWLDVTKVIGEDALLKYVSAHNISGHIPKLRARALCGVGKCLHAFALFASPDPPTQWVVHEMELSRIEQPEDQSSERSEDPESNQFLRYTKQIKKIKKHDDICHHYLAQASECLVQGLNVALQNHFCDIAGSISLELVECCGQYDPQSASLFLALYQSCSASNELEKLLNQAQMDPCTSRLAALLHQRKAMMDREVGLNLSVSGMMNTVTQSLEKNWQAWKNLEVQTNHLELLKDLPPHFNFIILQHSPDRSFLYGAVLDRPKNTALGGGGGKNPKQQAAPTHSRAKVFGAETSPQLLDELLTKFEEHHQNVQTLLLKQEYQRSQAMMRQKMLENLDESLKKQTQHHHDEEDQEEEARLQEEFRKLLKDMEAYLKPLTSQLMGILTPPVVTPTSTGKDNKGQPDTPPQEYVILLVDSMLMHMPLEALEFLQVENITSMSRDFSLSLFHHRFYKDEATDSQLQGSRKHKATESKTPTNSSRAGKILESEQQNEEKKKQKAKNQDNPLSRIPGLRDASKKQAKIIPLHRDLHPWHHTVDTMNFRYIVDSHLDCAETELNKPIEIFNKLMEDYEQQFTPRWLGVPGDDHTPSVGEWEIYLTDNSSFIFYGMEKFINYIPPSKLSALNIPDCSIIYLLDLAETSKSFTRQSKLDVRKSESFLALEKPVETAMLASLTGVKCLMANQWHCTLAENANRLKVSMKDLLEGGKTTGETVRLLFTPNQREQPKTEVEEKPPSPNDPANEMGENPEQNMAEKESEGLKEPQLDRSWYNMVCYGLPNLIVAQI